MDTLTSLWNAFGEAVLSKLPFSPFRSYLDYFSTVEFWPVLNWFFPVKDCLSVLSAWGSAIGLYYTYSVVCRWLKVIQ